MASLGDDTMALAASLHRHLAPLRLSGLSAVQATKQVTAETARWAEQQGWTVSYEVWGRISRMTEAGPRRARLDLVCARPGNRPSVAIEIDQTRKVWSLQKLRSEADAGRVALWVRWHGHTEVEIPDSVGLVDIHDTAGYQPSERPPRPAPVSPAAEHRPEATPEPLPDPAPEEQPPVLPSPDDIEAARTPAGGFTRAQLAAWGVAWPPPKGWKKKLNDRWHAAQPEQLRDT